VGSMGILGLEKPKAEQKNYCKNSINLAIK
jgi:hypothetical protein